MKSRANANHANPSTPNNNQSQQRQTAKEIIAANVKSLIEQLEAGHSEALTAYLDAMTCPRRSGYNTSLFADVQGDQCLDGPCFQSKVATHRSTSFTCSSVTFASLK
jgi:hypothetical protein